MGSGGYHFDDQELFWKVVNLLVLEKNNMKFKDSIWDLL